MMFKSPCKVMVVENEGKSMTADGYTNRLDAVCCMINNGALGGGVGGYGCDDHKAALDAVEKQIAETRKTISEDSAWVDPDSCELAGN